MSCEIAFDKPRLEAGTGLPRGEDPLSTYLSYLEREVAHDLPPMMPSQPAAWSVEEDGAQPK
ncbi:hypothetical protein IEQ34_018735 [Dendrobium chrysotoxum]|uniref:Uncharacterized protein n=1 Tax=Dendrobium chrysotoxum TaxID=161865 RepID=A0AAV7G4W5_DENCH|nr:hypothetical protein IEQ34_018735 [Dendrobium chrysotoxum]